MDLDIHQLDLRYQALRKHDPRQERLLLGSLAQIGQQAPIVVVAAPDHRFIVIDGYKRLRALKRLCKDQVVALPWEMSELDALLLVRMMRTSADDVLEQAWLVAELHQRFGQSLEVLAQRFDKTKSWVSRRLALVKELPDEIQQSVRLGEIAAHTAMKYLVPLARANAKVAARLTQAIRPLKPTTRQVGLLYQGLKSGTEQTRELILTSPQVYLRAREQAAPKPVDKSGAEQLLSDLNALSAIAARARKRMTSGVMEQLLPEEHNEVKRQLRYAKDTTSALFNRLTLETEHAR